jgi:hypothetical protein
MAVAALRQVATVIDSSRLLQLLCRQSLATATAVVASKSLCRCSRVTVSVVVVIGRVHGRGCVGRGFDAAVAIVASLGLHAEQPPTAVVVPQLRVCMSTLQVAYPEARACAVSPS